MKATSRVYEVAIAIEPAAECVYDGTLPVLTDAVRLRRGHLGKHAQWASDHAVIGRTGDFLVFCIIVCMVASGSTVVDAALNEKMRRFSENG